MSQVLNILKNGKCKLRNQENTTGEGGKLSHRKHLQKGSLKRQIAAILVKIRRNGERPPACTPSWVKEFFISSALQRNVFIITHNKISQLLTQNQRFSLKKKICALARKDICTVNKQIKFSLEWIYFFFFLSSAVQNLQAPSTWVIKQQQGCLKQPQTTAQGWAGWVLFRLTSLLSIQCFENTTALADTNYTRIQCRCNYSAEITCAHGDLTSQVHPKAGNAIQEAGEKSGLCPAGSGGKEANRHRGQWHLHTYSTQMGKYAPNITQQERKIQTPALECTGRNYLSPAKEKKIQANKTKQNKPKKTPKYFLIK